MATKIRLDKKLLDMGMAPSRQRAQGLIMAGLVRVNGQVVTKSGFNLPSDAVVEVEKPDHPYVSRGGLKLKGALDHFELKPLAYNCLDIGASTGGFTDCLLQSGAKAVTCVDVGYGQLAWKLRQDERVTSIERVNARHLPEDLAPGPFDLVVMDVSFISLTLVLPPLQNRLAPKGAILAMVKPQFEAGREAVGPGGVVRDEAIQMAAVEKIYGFLAKMGLSVKGHCKSPIKGPKGNQEYFILAVSE
ncbi:TlyA family RNA methyltransferase [Dethiosulfatarculus sandiegensis]|uniref:RNA methyltransferase n=1 Tax=Dethiosulfatarculus sandiegensis TaxID=1429043 RepID=A0A0D2HS71_9BACT|nr:TlyA family RNA methyltransferase [Dethiosulfatarculus sandiegensis]KIX13383.1 RNA methyltransferase [Dethiosulfatarculus sandiegensis]